MTVAEQIDAGELPSILQDANWRAYARFEASGYVGRVDRHVVRRRVGTTAGISADGRRGVGGRGLHMIGGIMSDVTRCGWLPADNQHHLTRPGMSDGDRAAWRARHGCQNLARWMLRSGGLSRVGEITWPVPCCTHHLGILIKIADGCDVRDHVVWSIDGAEPRPVQDVVMDAVAAERARMQVEIDAMKREHDAAATNYREVAKQRDAQSVKEMRRALGEYIGERQQRSGMQPVERRCVPPPAWFGGPLLDLMGKVFENTGEQGISSLVVSRDLGLQLRILPGECCTFDGLRIESMPAEPSINIKSAIFDVQIKNPTEWIADLDAAAERRLRRLRKPSDE